MTKLSEDNNFPVKDMQTSKTWATIINKERHQNKVPFHETISSLYFSVSGLAIDTFDKTSNTILNFFLSIFITFISFSVISCAQVVCN